MTSLVTILSTRITAGARLIKAICSGKTNVQEVREIAPHGYDGNAPKNRIAAYSDTPIQGVNIIYGYINTSQAVDVGAMRIYSTNTAGTSVQMYLHLKNDGTAEFGGTADNLVRYTPLNSAIQSSIVTFINTQLGLIATGIIAGGGSYTPGTMSVDISAAKITEIKTS